MDGPNAVHTHGGTLFGLSMEMPALATTRMNIEDIMLSERSQTAKDEQGVFPLL